MSNNQRTYPNTVAGLYQNSRSDYTNAQSMPLSQETADQICATIQKAVGGRLIVKATKGGLNKNGKKLPDFFLEATTAEIEAERKAYGEAQKAAQNDGDGAL